MHFQMVCLMSRNISLTDEIRAELVNAAQRMTQKGRDLERIKRKEVEGHLRSDWKTLCFGSFAGIKFEAEIETELGKGNVVFLVDEEHLTSDEVLGPENSFWMTLPSEPGKARAKAQCN